jgi:hypothetical protein
MFYVTLASSKTLVWVMHGQLFGRPHFNPEDTLMHVLPLNVNIILFYCLAFAWLYD